MIKKTREIKKLMQDGWNLFSMGNKVHKVWLSVHYSTDAKPVALSTFYSLKHADEIETHITYNGITLWKLREE